MASDFRYKWVWKENERAPSKLQYLSRDILIFYRNVLIIYDNLIQVIIIPVDGLDACETKLGHVECPNCLQLHQGRLIRQYSGPGQWCKLRSVHIRHFISVKKSYGRCDVKNADNSINFALNAVPFPLHTISCCDSYGDKGCWWRLLCFLIQETNLQQFALNERSNNPKTFKTIIVDTTQELDPAGLQGN